MDSREKIALSFAAFLSVVFVNAQTVTGTGTLNSIPKFTSTGSVIGNSQITDDGSFVAIGGIASVGTGSAQKLTVGSGLVVSLTTTNANKSFPYIRATANFSTASAPDYTFWGNNQTGIFHPANNTLGITTFSVERMRITSTGNVGIGTSTPIQNLDINGRVNVTNGVIQRGGSAITNTSDLGLYSLVPGNYIRMVTNAAPFRFYTDGASNPVGGNSVFSIESNGSVVVGNSSTLGMPSGYKLYVETGILTPKVKVAVPTSTNWSDYVFEKNYKLKPLNEVAEYIEVNKHLPNIPSAEEVVKNGLDVATMDAKLLEKIEELTLYIIQQNKRIETLEKLVSKNKN